MKIKLLEMVLFKTLSGHLRMWRRTAVETVACPGYIRTYCTPQQASSRSPTHTESLNGKNESIHW